MNHDDENLVSVVSAVSLFGGLKCFGNKPFPILICNLQGNLSERLSNIKSNRKHLSMSV